VAAEPFPVMVPVVWPTMVTWGADRVHASVPETDPRTTSKRLPDATDVGSVPPVVTTTVSASVAQRASWWLMHTPGPRPAHSVSAAQPRQVLVAVAQTGVVPAQVVLSVHCTQAPPAAQAGVALLLAAHWAAAVQPAQTFAVHIGVAPEQVALVRHWTHLFALVSHREVAPPQVVLSVHATHWPALLPLVAQAGVVGLLAAH
jgi:hypothetical protein